MEPIFCPETSVRICHYSQRNSLEERWVILDRKSSQISHLFQ